MLGTKPLPFTAKKSIHNHPIEARKAKVLRFKSVEANRLTEHNWKGYRNSCCKITKQSNRRPSLASKHLDGSLGRPVYRNSFKAISRASTYNLEL